MSVRAKLFDDLCRKMCLFIGCRYLFYQRKGDFISDTAGFYYFPIVIYKDSFHIREAFDVGKSLLCTHAKGRSGEGISIGRTFAYDGNGGKVILYRHSGFDI